MLTQLIDQCSHGLVERRALVEAIVLAAVAKEHVLLIGPPGTAKSEAARRVARAFGGRYFEYLLGRFSEPSEIFGPTDLRKLQDGVLETATAGMLPEADIAFLDEVFAGSTAILNTLLTLLNERVFKRGGTNISCPLRVCIGASNNLPNNESLAAFADRFLVRCFVEPVSESQLEALLAGGFTEAKVTPAELSQLDELSELAAEMDLEEVRPLLAQALRRLRKEGIELSDRRAVRSQKLIAAAAAIAGRVRATQADLWPIVLTVPTAEQQILAKDSLKDLLKETDNQALYHIADTISEAKNLRARMLSEAAKKALEGADDELRFEAVLRDIDSQFSPEDLPDELKDLRDKLKSRLS